MKVYALKTCDTCRKALKALGAAGLSPQVIDVRGDGVTKADIARWLTGVDAGTLVNRKSTTWRGLTDDEKARADGAGLAGLLVEYPTLIKRPVIEANGKVTVGWTATEQKTWLE